MYICTNTHRERHRHRQTYTHTHTHTQSQTSYIYTHTHTHTIVTVARLLFAHWLGSENLHLLANARAALATPKLAASLRLKRGTGGT